MTPLTHLIPTTAVLVAVAHAHFELSHPIALDSEGEGSQDVGPCGGLTPDFDVNTVTDFHVGGDAIALLNGHAQANILFRATLDKTGEGEWTQGFPVVTQTGIGAFCQPMAAVPEEFVGLQGVIGVVANAPDGLLYQCAAVNFVEGVGELPEKCTNGSSVEVTFTSDDDLSALVGEGSSTDEETPSGSDDDASEPTSTEDPKAAARALGPAAGWLFTAVLAVGIALW